MTVENQTISAVIDGEASYAEGGSFLDVAASCTETAGTAARYQLIGACLRGHTAVDTSGLFDRIHSQLQDEPTVLAPAAMKQSTGSTKKTAAGFAVAASVAAAVVFTVFRTELPTTGTVVADNAPVVESSAPAIAPTLVADSGTQPASAMETVSQVEIDTGNPDLDRYLRAHQDYTGSGSFGPGFATATMVSYGGR
jgi:sigma-E factor negative regulatory protein RseA